MRLFTLALIGMLTAAVLAPDVLARKGDDEPELIVVQHILVTFKRADPKKRTQRTKKEAEQLAQQLLKRAQDGEDFEALVAKYTGDSVPGVYPMTNEGQPMRADAYPRKQMAAAFGNVAFGLAVGEIGMARYSAGSSPYGWHIIKRLE